MIGPSRLALATLGVAVLMVAGCGPSTTQPTANPPASSSPSIATAGASATYASPADEAMDKALAAYRGMWAAYQEAGETANPDDPGLAVHAIDGALQTLVNGLRSIRDRGLVIKGEIVLNPHVTRLEPVDAPTTVEVTDCADTTNSLLYRAPGELYNDEPGGRRLVIATVKDTGGGVWKVASFGAQAVGTC